MIVRTGRRFDVKVIKRVHLETFQENGEVYTKVLSIELEGGAKLVPMTRELEGDYATELLYLPAGVDLLHQRTEAP